MRAEIIQGDCLVEMPKLIERGLIFDACITDPPQEITDCSWDVIIPLNPMWDCLKRLIRPDRAIVLMTNEPYGSLAVASNLQMFKHEWIWAKNRASNFLNAKVQPMKEHETIKVFCQQSPLYNPQKSESHTPVNFARRKANSSNVYGFHREAVNNAGTTDRYPRSILPFDCVDNCSSERYHENQKPVPLLRYLLRTYTNEGDTVLDFSCGSGSLGEACMIEKRNCVLIDKDAFNCEVATARSRRAQGIAADIPKSQKPDKFYPLFDVA